MGKRTQPYRLGFPAKYVDKSQGKSDTKSTTAEAVALLKRGQEAAKKGEKLPDSYFKARVAKKGAKVSRKALSASVKKTLQAKAKSLASLTVYWSRCTAEVRALGCQEVAAGVLLWQLGLWAE